MWYDNKKYAPKEAQYGSKEQSTPEEAGRQTA